MKQSPKSAAPVNRAEVPPFRLAWPSAYYPPALKPHQNSFHLYNITWFVPWGILKSYLLLPGSLFGVTRRQQRRIRRRKLLSTFVQAERCSFLPQQFSRRSSESGPDEEARYHMPWRRIKCFETISDWITHKVKTTRNSSKLDEFEFKGRAAIQYVNKCSISVCMALLPLSRSTYRSGLRKTKGCGRFNHKSMKIVISAVKRKGGGATDRSHVSLFWNEKKIEPCAGHDNINDFLQKKLRALCSLKHKF